MTSRRKTVLHLIASNFFGGPERQIVNHLGLLSQEHYRGLVGSFFERHQPNEVLDEAARRNLENRGIAMAGPWDVRAQFSLSNLLQKERADLLCTHGYKATVMGWVAARRCGLPVLAFSRGYTAEDLKVSFYEWIERQVLPRVDGVVCVSEGQRRKLKSLGVRARRTWVVHNAIALNGKVPPVDGADGRDCRRRLGVPDEALLIVSAGRLSPEKGHRYLVEAAAHVAQVHPEAIFVFCGDGPCQGALEEQARSLGVGERCRFVGFRKDIEEVFGAMDLMVLPSLTEGLPNVVLESFAAAKPVVATAVGGVPELVEDGVNGLLVPAEDPTALAEAIRRMLDSGETRQRMGRAGYETVNTRFTTEEQNCGLEVIYDEILQGRAG